MAAKRMHAPVHPGEILREDVLPTLGLSISGAARHLGITRQMLHRILLGESRVTPEMAVRIGKLCGNGAEIWLRMQVAHDLWHAEKALKRQIRDIPTLSGA